MFLKPGSHMSSMIGESLSVTIQGENSQRILLMSSHKQWSSPMSATYENQAIFIAFAAYTTCLPWSTDLCVTPFTALLHFTCCRPDLVIAHLPELIAYNE